jgi:hypothetical protein
VRRWAQTNLTEIDPARCDPAFWRDYWRRSHIQGVILNAGGIIAYYPSRLPLSHPAAHLGQRDLFGELVEAARQEGLAVLARMDSNRVHESVFIEHPDWIAVDASGQPYRAGAEYYITCIDSPYYQEHLPEVLKEIARTYAPDGFTDNSFSGLDRDHISYSPHARRRFKQAAGLDLPRCKDWDDPAYRQWLRYSYARRLEIWDLNNRAAREAGGPDCLWMGMVGGDFARQGAGFRDLRSICERSSMLMLDFQSRPGSGGFWANAEAGKLYHGLLGWDRPIAESMAMYAHGRPFRLSSNSEPEARLWMVEGFAGGILPWIHHIGAYHEDRRQYGLAGPLLDWHARNEAYLVHRTPVAAVGVVWSQENADFYGRDDPQVRVSQPWQGFARALVRGRLPTLPIHADQIDAQAGDRSAEGGLAALILPNLGLLTEGQAGAVQRFVERGGGLVVTGEAGLYGAWGERRPDFLLADLLGVHALGAAHGRAVPPSSGWEDWSGHSYLRLPPGQDASVERGPFLQGFDETDLLPFGGRLEAVAVDPGAGIPLTYVPPFPVYPPELAWMRRPSSALPALVLRQGPAGSRLAYLAADLDRCYAREGLPDHGRLLANLARWVVGDRLPFQVLGPGLIDCHLYRQPGRRILHLVNLTGTEERPLHELVRVGPLEVRLRTAAGRGTPARARLLVAGDTVETRLEGGWHILFVPSVLDHEVIVIEE